jgi:hypothetical protein
VFARPWGRGVLTTGPSLLFSFDGVLEDCIASSKGKGQGKAGRWEGEKESGRAGTFHVSIELQV